MRSGNFDLCDFQEDAESFILLQSTQRRRKVRKSKALLISPLRSLRKSWRPLRLMNLSSFF